jgi:ADP-ribose pyrophosphatase
MVQLRRGKLIEKRRVYAGKIIDLEVDAIDYRGTAAVREVVRHPGGVVILAEVARDRIVFVRQHRYPLDRDLLELPAGKLDPGEEPAQTAARELEEETGFRAQSLELVTSYYTSPGFCDELLRFFYTDQVVYYCASPEFDEDLHVEFHGLQEALDMIRSGEIQDGKTIAALYWLAWQRSRGG